MIDFPFLSDVIQRTDSKIIMLVVDGLGGAPSAVTKRSELESARTPNLDQLAQESVCGLTIPVSPGITPGSGPGHLSLFGYDPLKYLIGRGALEALGIDLDFQPGDVAARGNFATVDSKGLLTDRRANRISSELAEPICAKLDHILTSKGELTVAHVKDYRFVLRLRGQGLSDRISETDPQNIGKPPLTVEPLGTGAQATADIVNEFVEKASEILREETQANMLLLRGWATLPKLPNMSAMYQIDAAAIAAYPMYRGLARTVGMEVLPTGSTFDSEVKTLKDHFSEYTFFYLHYKPADAAGEDGDFQKKMTALELLDEHIPQLRSLNADVLIVAGDHATPSIMASHSWHPVPFMLHSPISHGDGIDQFSERAFRNGSLGQFEAKHIMSLALAHAGKLQKFGP